MEVWKYICKNQKEKQNGILTFEVLLTMNSLNLMTSSEREITYFYANFHRRLWADLHLQCNTWQKNIIPLRVKRYKYFH